MIVTMIHVIASITVKPGQRSAFLAQFQRIVEPTRAEDGCLLYQPTIDVAERIHERQGAERPDVVTVVETWRDLQALQAHLAAPHMAAHRLRVKDLVLTSHLLVTRAS
jgi:quinol monooxygenase YgiN